MKDEIIKIIKEIENEKIIKLIYGFIVHLTKTSASK